jgi:hypothetical protein
MEVTATTLIRKMRGAAQAHLLECDDGHFYVVKFQNNPQHRRILINEWLACSLLAYLGISTPKIAVVNLSAEFLIRNPGVHIQLHSRRLAVEPGKHFGSLYRGKTSDAIIYDFMPDVLHGKVTNWTDFLGAIVLDKWTGNVDARQAIFTRPVTLRASKPGYESRHFLASMIDQGYAFGGHEWKFMDSPFNGLYIATSVYRHVRSRDDFQPWLDRVVNFPKEVLDNARSQIPSEWVMGDEEILDALLCRLMARRHRVGDLVAESVNARENPFPEWSEARTGHAASN